MMRWLIFPFVASTLLAQQPATPESVLKLYDARVAVTKSWQANFMKMVAQGTNTITQSGTVRIVRLPNAQQKARADFVMRLAGRELNYRIISGSDNVVWQLIEDKQRQAIFKLDLNQPIKGVNADPRKFNPVNEVNPNSVFEQYRAQLEFTVEAAQDLGGRKCFQVVGKPKVNLTQPLGSVRAWIGADDGFLYRIVVSDLRGSPALAIDLSGVRLDLELDDALFSFTPQPGANIQDLNSRLGKAIQ